MNSLYVLLILSLFISIMTYVDVIPICEGTPWVITLHEGTTYRYYLSAGTGMTANINFTIHEEKIKYFPQTIYVYEFPSWPLVSYNTRSSVTFNKTLENSFYTYKISYSPVKGTTIYVAFEIELYHSCLVSAKANTSGILKILTIDYDLTEGISQAIRTISKADIYKFYLPVNYGQIGNIKIILPSSNYSFSNSYTFEYISRNSSYDYNKEKMILNKSTDNSTITLTSSKTVLYTSTKYVAFQFSSSYDINNLIILGNVSVNYNTKTDKINDSNYNIILIIILVFIIVLLAIFLVSKYYINKKDKNEILNHSKENSSSDKNQNLLPTEK